jgi:hypothetical protein
MAVRFKDKITIKRQLLWLAGISLILMTVIKVGSVADPGRWNGVIARLEMGLKGNALEIVCGGTGVLRKSLEHDGQVISPEISKLLDSIASGDGSRVVTARAALSLSAAHPMGINQSKLAYQIAIEKVCNPTIVMSHAHDGWIDTALAIGIPGAILYFLVLANFAKSGLRSLRLDETNRPYALALFVTSVIWIVRAFFDSTLRDQMLEMQVFTIAFLHGFIVSNSTHPAENQRQS